ncbi:MAG: KpsF/GutQ family sugar-phosphate isomerase [Bacteroidales bacterium]|nr:KpsF/GutQ family sugar-phosphate isomerase [Bacteroidales bacterium]
MSSNFDIKTFIKDTILQEARAIEHLTEYIDEDFERAVQTIFASKGRVIITGIGKSAKVADKIVATLNSTGTPSLFMHAAEAIHGDLGMIQPSDVVICISKSGNTPEIKVLLPLIKAFGNKIIAICGEKSSFLGQNADCFLNSYVDKEADPNNLAPTCSTTAQLVIGDALSIALLRLRGFNSSDFAKYHPGGSLGKRLYLRVSDLYKANEKPWIDFSTPLSDALLEISSKRLGCTAVVEGSRVTGIITDGDLRRFLSAHKENINMQSPAHLIMTADPKTIHEEDYAVKALNIMRENSITQLLVTDNDNNYLGVIHLHDLLREGII